MCLSRNKQTKKMIAIHRRTKYIHKVNRPNRNDTIEHAICNSAAWDNGVLGVRVKWRAGILWSLESQMKIKTRNV